MRYGSSDLCGYDGATARCAMWAGDAGCYEAAGLSRGAEVATGVRRVCAAQTAVEASAVHRGSRLYAASSNLRKQRQAQVADLSSRADGLVALVKQPPGRR